MLIITLMFYLIDVKSYGIDFVNANCGLCERIGQMVRNVWLVRGFAHKLHTIAY